MGVLDVLGVGSNILSNLVNLGGVIGTNLVNRRNVQDTNSLNLAIAREMNQSQIDLANTAVQRRSADLQAAGFNKLLAATGEGASTPSLSSPSMQAFQAQAGSADFGSIFGNALELAQYKRDVKMQEENIAALKDQRKLYQAEINKYNAETKAQEMQNNFFADEYDSLIDYNSKKRQNELASQYLSNKAIEQENSIREPDAYLSREYGYRSATSGLGKIVQDLANLWGVTNPKDIEMREQKKQEQKENGTDLGSKTKKMANKLYKFTKKFLIP